MGLADPTSPAGADPDDVRALAPRVDDLDGTRIGLYDNGKMAAEPVLAVLGEALESRHPDATIVTFSLAEKYEIADPSVVERVTAWARDEIDACVGAIGDCGSCTKFLTWGLEAIEGAGVPAVGLVDEGFVLDFKSNAIERGMPLRYEDTAVRAEVRDHDLIRDRMTPDAIDAIERELTRPLSDAERGAPS